VEKKKFGGYDYAFSVIMAVYNVEKYLREAMDSLIHQNFGFEKIQVILVDDGSPDGSGAICDEYQRKYPDNVVVVHKENGGVSSARNVGMEFAKGQYYNFLDSDDKLSLNTMRDVYRFFQEHEGETDVAVIPMHIFEAEERSHPLNFKFDGGTRVIDLTKEWAIPHSNTNTAFIHAECASKLRFDIRLAYCEDGCFISKAMLHKATIGMVSTAKYFYRMRVAGTSAMQTSRGRAAWYLPPVRYFMEEVFRYAKELRGEVPLFTQFNIMNEIQWRINQENIPTGVLTDEEREEYQRGIFDILKQIDDRVVGMQRFISQQSKYYIVRHNHEEAPDEVWHDHLPMLSYSDHIFATLQSMSLSYTNITVEGNEGIVQGYLSVPANSYQGFKLALRCNGKELDCELIEAGATKTFLGDAVCVRYNFKSRIKLNVKGSMRISPRIHYGFNSVKLQTVTYGFATPLAKNNGDSYALMGDYVLTHLGSDLVLARRKAGMHIYREIRIVHNFLKKKKRREALVHLVSNLYQQAKGRSNWLIYAAKDVKRQNLLRLINELHQEAPNAKLYVIMEKKAKDEKCIGDAFVVPWPVESRQYKLFLTTCQRLYCRGKDWTKVNPFAPVHNPYRDLLGGAEIGLLDNSYHIMSFMPCDKARMPVGVAAKQIWEAFYRKLVGNRCSKTLKKWFWKILKCSHQDVVLFESIPPYRDNTWKVYETIRQQGWLKKYKLIWVLEPGNKPVKGIPSVVLGHSLFAKWRYNLIAARTKAFVYCNRRQYKVRDGQLAINLGHGSCLKSVHGHYSMPADLDYLVLQSKVFEGATRYEHDISDHTVLAPLGYPRNDDFYGLEAADRKSLFMQPFDKLLVWFPTYRQHKNGTNIASSITIPLIHDADSAARINACAAENGVLIVIKPHFAQDTSYINKSTMSNLHFIDDTFFSENDLTPYQFLHMSDGLITDYSSVYYDYLLQDKPIALIWEDVEEYIRHGGFAVDTDVYCAGGEKVYTEEELCAFIRRVARGEDVLRESRAEVRDMTNAHADGQTSLRVAKWVKDVIDAYPEKIQ